MSESMKKMMAKVTERFFKPVDNAVWDFSTGSVGIVQGGSILTLVGDEENPQVSENPFNTFGMPIPAFAQMVPAKSVKFGDILFNSEGLQGWVLKQNEKSIGIMSPRGALSNIVPRKVQMMGAGGDTVLVLSSMLSLAGGESGFLGMQQNMLPFLMMMDEKEMPDMMPLVLMSTMGQQGNAAGGMAGMNPLMLMMMMKGRNGGFFE